MLIDAQNNIKRINYKTCCSIFATDFCSTDSYSFLNCWSLLELSKTQSKGLWLVKRLRWPQREKMTKEIEKLMMRIVTIHLSIRFITTYYWIEGWRWRSEMKTVFHSLDSVISSSSFNTKELVWNENEDHSIPYL